MAKPFFTTQRIASGQAILRTLAPAAALVGQTEY